MTEKMEMNFYRCGNEGSHIRTMGTTIAEAMRSLGCMGCKAADGCSGPVLLEDIAFPAPQKTKTPPPLKEWREGIPPQGRYLLDLDDGEEMQPVNVGHGIFEWDGEVHPISFAFEVGTLRGPIQKNKEEKEMKHKKAQKAVEAMEKVLEDVSAKGSTSAIREFARKFSEADLNLPDMPEALASETCTDVDETVIDRDTREAIREELLELAKTLPAWKHRSIAPVLAKTFGEEIKALRNNGHSWEAIAKVMRKHGLRVSKELLKANAEG
jgi:hypothetical protein